MHPTLQVIGVAEELGAKQLGSALPLLMERLQPLFLVDHVAAV